MRLAMVAVVMGLTGFLLPMPPVKMGLWETTMVKTTTLPPALAEKMKQAGQPVGVPATTVTRACFTADTWQSLTGMMANMPAGCTTSDMVSNAKVVNFKMTCTMGGMSMVSDSKSTFDSSELVTGMLTMTMGTGSNSSVTTMKMTSKFIGSDCGSVQPAKIPQVPH